LKQQKIVITGGPSTGKTSLITALEKKQFYCFHEVIRLMTLEAKNKGSLGNLSSNPINTVSDPMGFNKRIINARLDDYKAAEKINKSMVFYDRGIPDVLAYMDYFEQKYDSWFKTIATDNPYDFVFLLPIWKEIYTQDGERFESYEEALGIHKCLYNSYSNLGYNVIEVPKDTIKNRIAFIINHIKTN